MKMSGTQKELVAHLRSRASAEDAVASNGKTARDRMYYEGRASAFRAAAKAVEDTEILEGAMLAMDG